MQCHSVAVAVVHIEKDTYALTISPSVQGTAVTTDVNVEMQAATMASFGPKLVFMAEKLFSGLD